MIDYLEHIDYFSEHSWADFTKLFPASEWGNKNNAKAYLEKYWLSQEEYENVWKPIQDKIFINQDVGLPELIFAEHYNIFAFRGGCLFLEEDFKQLQKCLLAIGEKYFVVIENSFGGRLQEPAFRVKFPTNITWQELMSGNYISAVLFEMLFNEYFVFGESTIWGKYSANDYVNPLDLIGFKPEYSPIFREDLKQSNAEKLEIKKWLPPKYIDYTI